MPAPSASDVETMRRAVSRFPSPMLRATSAVVPIATNENRLVRNHWT
ncbi:MAG: hypothetical protein QM811_20770 [Pirellulales bacterium]